jgi:hypothetical protein
MHPDLGLQVPMRIRGRQLEAHFFSRRHVEARAVRLAIPGRRLQQPLCPYFYWHCQLRGEAGGRGGYCPGKGSGRGGPVSGREVGA